MKTISTALRTLLRTSKVLYMGDLFTFTLRSGTILRYTSFDRDITVEGQRFVRMPINRGTIKEERGLSVDELDVDLFFDENDTIPGGATIGQALHNGAFKGAELLLQRVYLPQWEDYLRVKATIQSSFTVPFQFSQEDGSFIPYMVIVPSDFTLTRFLGVADIDEMDETAVKFNVKSMTYLLNSQQPKNLINPGCGLNLYDEPCGVDRSAWEVQGSILSSSNQRQLNCTLNQANGYFDLGVIIFTSGPNTGIRRSVKSYLIGQVTLSLRLPFTPQTGDQFKIYPGCDHTMNMCKNRYNNLAKYRGFPFVPMPEALI